VSVLRSGYLHIGEHVPGFSCVCQSLMQNFNGRFFATTASGSATGRLPQLPHIAHAVFHRLADIGIGYSIADTHVHKNFPVMTKIILSVNANDCQLDSKIVLNTFK
jgi:hypothetical protein